MGLLSSLLLNQASSWPLRAAERLEVSIEGVVLPVEVNDLRAWATSSGMVRTELGPWMQLLDQESRTGLMQLLQAPVLTRSSFGEQILRSWSAGPLLDAIGDVIRLTDGDRISSDLGSTRHQPSEGKQRKRRKPRKELKQNQRQELQ